jgi:hypothetical protein
VTITGDGLGATARALLAPAGVASVTVTNGGTGFTSVPTLNLLGVEDQAQQLLLL